MAAFDLGMYLGVLEQPAVTDAARSSPAQRDARRWSIVANSKAMVKEAGDVLGAKSIFRYLSNICGVVRN